MSGVVAKVRSIKGCCFVITLSVAGIAAAEPKPEDPYPDVVSPPAVVEASKPKPVTAAPASEPTTADDPEWWEDEAWWEDNAWIGVVIGLVALIWIGRRRNIAAHRRIERENRRTQFQMSAIDPTIAEQHATVWERGPTIVPTAIEAAMVSPRRRRFADGTAQPIANPRPSVPTALGLQPPAPYPLTFPAFPEPAGVVMLQPIEPSNINRWHDPSADYAIPFARGSQPADQFEPMRILPADAQTMIIEPSDSTTLVSHGAPRRRA